MAQDELKTAAVALGLLGLGVAGYFALSEYDRRRAFEAALRTALDERGGNFVSARLGRSDTGNPVWYVTVNHPWQGLTTYSAEFPVGTDAYSEATCHDLITRVVGTIGLLAR